MAGGGGINISGPIYICDEQCLFNFDDLPQTDIVVQNENNQLTITVSGDSFINFISEEFCPEYDRYQLREITITSPSKHAVYGKKFPIEVELFYSSHDKKDTVILSVLGDSASGSATNSPLFSKLAGDLFPQHLKSVRAPVEWTVDQLLPKERTYFTYHKSARVKNIVFENPVQIPAKLITNFQEYVITPAEFTANIAKKAPSPGTKTVIYATVPPPVLKRPPITESNQVNVIEHFEDTNFKETEREYGFLPLFVLGFYLIALTAIAGISFSIGPNYVSDLFRRLLNVRIEIYAAVIIAIIFAIIAIYVIPINTGVSAGIGYTLLAIGALILIYMGYTIYRMIKGTAGIEMSWWGIGSIVSMIIIVFCLYILFITSTELPSNFGAIISISLFVYIGATVLLMMLGSEGTTSIAPGVPGKSLWEKIEGWFKSECEDITLIGVPAEDWVGYPTIPPTYGSALSTHGAAVSTTTSLPPEYGIGVEIEPSAAPASAATAAASAPAPKTRLRSQSQPG